MQNQQIFANQGKHEKCQDPGDPGVGKVRGGGGFFFLQAGRGADPG